MTDFEYTILCIHRRAKRIVALTAKPEIGLYTWSAAVGAEMIRLGELNVCQGCPPEYQNRDFNAVMAGEA